jgi:guanosine-3',5'-bis(diphosphate) 3'-pyrophosphohydrolase
MSVIESAQRHQDLIDELIDTVAAYNKDVDRVLISRAFVFAAAAHEGQQRRSGEDFINHPWGAAKIIAELRLGLLAAPAGSTLTSPLGVKT